LETLNLSDNQIEDLDFRGMYFPSLTKLNLNFNPGLNFAVVKGFSVAMPELRELHLRRSSLFVLTPEIGGLNRLEFLDVSYNQLKSLPDGLKDTRLKVLRVRDNNLQNAIWALELWRLESLDISNNKGLQLDAVSHALLFKDLKELTITTGIEGNELTSVFKDVQTNKLVLRSANTSDLVKGITGNKHIKHLVFQGASISNERSFYTWINKLENLQTLEFVNMSLPVGFKGISSPEKVVLDLCSMSNPGELEQIDPSVQVRAVNMKSGIAKGELADTPCKIEDISDDMIQNNVAPVAKPKAVEKTIDSQKGEIVVLENTAYDIPENAFLTADGEVYEGRVDLKITEYNDAMTNALSGAPMVYRDGSTNQIFSSAGMLEFRAYDENGEELQPNPTNTIQVEMFDLQPSEETRLYTYDEADSNWVDVGQAEASDQGDLRQRILDSLNQLPDDFFYTINTVSPDFVMEYDKNRLDPWEIQFDVNREGVVSDKKLKGAFSKCFLDQTWLVRGKKVLVVDTVMTDELEELLKDIGTKSKRYKRYKNNKRLAGSYIPPSINQLSLEPDFTNDNYRLRFKFQGQTVDLPVAFKDRQKSVERAQRKEKERVETLVRAKERAEGKLARFNAMRDKRTALAVQKIREQRADYLSSPEYLEWRKIQQERAVLQDNMNRETLRFGLTSFGLVNCDYFYRNEPDAYIASTNHTYDENGDKIEVPNNIRNVIVEDNVYLSTTNDRIPQFERKRTFLFFVIGATKIAIITGWERITGGKSRPIIKTVSTEGMSPGEVREKILQL